MERAIVTCVAVDNQEDVIAYIYHKDDCDKSIHIEGGDWVSRDKISIGVTLLEKVFPQTDKETIERALKRANGDVRLAKSLLRWCH